MILPRLLRSSIFLVFAAASFGSLAQVHGQPEPELFAADTESPTEDYDAASMMTQGPTETIGFGGLPVDDGRDELSTQECTDDYNGTVVGDIGNGAIFRPDYLCESNGLPPIGNIRFAPGEPIPIEGAVCCGPPTTVMPPMMYDYFTLDSAAGGCIGRKQDGSDELFLKECTSDDDYIQWRFDEQGYFRSKVNDDECMQAGQVPEITDGVEALVAGTTMYVKECVDGGLKQDFQVMDESFATLGGLSGPIYLESRPDLCVVHFGANPTIGESRIMLLECDSLGGQRALGWEADNPCTHEPDKCY